jgi:hypothetical protein
MALTPTERSICNKIVADFDPLLAPVFAVKPAIRSAAREFENGLFSTIFSSDSAVDSAISDFQDGLSEIIPGDSLTDVQAIKDMIDNCSYLGGLSASSAAAGTVLGVFDGIGGIIDTLSSASPEFGLGNIANTINKVLDGIQFPFGDKIADLLSRADQLIQCLAAYCGGEYPSQVIEFTQTVEDLYGDLNVVSNPADPRFGSFDYENLYAKANIPLADRAKVDRVKASITAGNNEAKQAVDNTIQAVKDAAKIGGIGGFI